MVQLLSLHSPVAHGKPEPSIVMYCRQVLVLAATSKLEAMIVAALPLSGIQKFNLLSSAVLGFRAIAGDDASPSETCYPALYQVVKPQLQKKTVSSKQ